MPPDETISVEFCFKNIKLFLALSDNLIRVVAENSDLNKRVVTHIEADKVFPVQITGYTVKNGVSTAEDLEIPEKAILWLINDQ